MIQAAAVHKDGRPIAIVGLSRRNTELLLEGKPIEIDLAKFGLAGVLILLGGETEAAIQAELATHMGNL